MNRNAILPSLILIVSPLTLTSCFSSSKVDTKNERSVGQQLTDLDAAYKQSIITEKEYLKLKKAIINKND
ncbi:MAG: hypothetical protein ABI162_18265 [Luteolibacter sp.]